MADIITSSSAIAISSSPPSPPPANVSSSSSSLSSSLPTLGSPTSRSLVHSTTIPDDQDNDDYSDDYDAESIAPAAGPSESHRKRLKDPWAYRSYQPTLPCANKLLQQKWDSVAQRDHAAKIRNAAATVDTAPPKKYSHLVNQKRKMRTKIELAAKLHAENKNLLRRIKRQITSAPMAGLLPTPGIKSSAPSGEAVIHSVGKNGPRNRMLREQTKRENELILQRLEASEPHYSQEDFERERVHTLFYLQNISKFPWRYKKELEAFGSPLRSTTPSTDYHPHPPIRPKSAPTPQPPRPPPLPQSLSIDVPKRWGPKAPIVPRVARLRPRSAPVAETLKEPEKPKVKVPLVPRVAYLAKKPESKITETKKPPPLPAVEIPGLHTFEDAFPGDEEMHVTGDGFTVGTGKGNVVSSRHSDSDEATKCLLSGVPAFSPGFVLPEPTSTSVKVFLSSVKGDLAEERERFMEIGVPQIREACLAMGLEFRAVDMRWGVKEMWFEPTQWTKLSHWELERDVKESLSVSTIVFFGKSAYGPRCLPSEIDESVFERLRKQAKRLEETGFYKSDEFSWGVTMLENWYEIDENYVPARRVLKPLSVMMPGFEDVKKKAYWWRIWEEQTFPVLQRILRISALSLAHKRILDPPSVQRLVQSFFQEEVVRGILKQSRRGSWERGVLVTNSLDVEEAMPVVLDSGADPKEVEEVVKKARNETRLLGELWNNLFAAVPYENRILEKTEIEADESDDRTQLLVEELTEKVKKLIIRSMNFRTKPNPLVEEILVHTTQFRLKSRDHIRRQHLIDKVINFMSRPDSWPLPPFLLYGEASMGRTSLLGKALQKFVQKAVDAPSPMNYYDTKSNASRAESPMPLLSSQSDKGNMNASMSTPSLASPRRRRSVASVVRPVVIARIANLTPDSSSPALLMASLTRQICAAYNVAVDDNDEINVEVFREALRLACPERPLIIVIAKVDRLPTEGPTTLKFSWLTDSIPSYVRIVLSAREEKKKNGTVPFIQSRISAAVPAILSAAAKASGLPHPESDAATVMEQFMLKTGDLILPVVKASIKKWMDVDGRKLKADQIDAITKAFQNSTPSENGSLCIRMLKCLYVMSRKWKSSDSEVLTVFPKSMQETMELVLVGIEDVNGVELAKTALSLLAVSRDGLTQSELEDLLSLDDDVLEECYKFDERPKIRIPPYFMTRLLYSISDFTVRRNSWGGELISISSDADFLAAIDERYLKNDEKVKYMEMLSQYFLGTFYTGKPFLKKTADGETVSLFSERNILPMPVRLPLVPGYSDIKTGGEGLWNVRKIRELPRLLAKLDAWRVFGLMLEDLDFIHGLRETMSISRAIEDLYAFLCIGDQNESFEFSIIAPKVEAALDFLTWVRYFLSITPINLQRTIIYEHVLRIPLEFSPFVLDDDISKAVSVLGWSGFERKEMAGLGILQCEPFWYPQLRCSQPVNRSLSEEQIGYPDHHPPVLHLSLAHEPRFRIMIQSTRDCTFFGKSDDKAVWKRPCLRPYASFMHRRHVLLTTSPDGRYVASLCANGTVKVFDSTTFAELWSFISGGRVTALNFQPSTTNCEYLLTAGIGGITRWSLKKGVSTCTITGKKSGVNANPVSCGFVMDNRERTYCRAYALFVTGYLVIWDLESGSILKSIPPDEDDDEFFSYGSACVSMDGRYLLYGSRMVKMYQCSSLVPFWSQPLFPRSAADLKMHRVTHFKFSDDNSSFYVISNLGSKDNENVDPRSDVEWRGVVQRWEFQTRTSRILTRLGSRATSISVTWDNRLIAIGGENGNVDVIKAFSGTRVATEPFAHTISSVAFIPDLRFSETTSTSSSHYYKRRSSWMGIGVTDGIDRTELERLSANSRPGTYRLCTGSIDGMIRVLGFQSDPEANAKSAITAARLSSDGQYVLLAGGEDSDTFNMLPSCFMQGQRNESKAGTFRNRLASTAVIHRQESIELINDLVLGASKMRNKSEIAWEASTMSLAANGKHGRSISMMTTREDVKDNKRTKSAVQLSPSTKPSSPIPGEESGARGDSVLKADNLASSHLSMYDLTTRTVETTMVSMYEVATGKLICSFSTRGDIIWCDFDKNSDGSIKSIVTGDRSGTVRFWCVGPHLKFDDGRITQIDQTLSDLQIEVFEMKVAESASTDLVVGYALNQVTSTLAVALTFDPSDLKNVPEGVTIEQQTTTGLITTIDLWDFATGLQMDALSLSVDALPCILGPQANPLLSLSWSLPSEEITRFHSLHFDSSVPSHPSALGVGPVRVYLRTDENPQTSLPLSKIIEEYVGPDAAAKCTSSCQSKYDARVMILGFGDVIYWICEERFPVIKLPQEVELVSGSSVRQSMSKVERQSQAEKVAQVVEAVEMAEKTASELNPKTEGEAANKGEPFVPIVESDTNEVKKDGQNTKSLSASEVVTTDTAEEALGTETNTPHQHPPSIEPENLMETNAVSPEVTTTSQPTQLLPTAEPNATSVEPTPIGLSTSPSHPSLLEAQSPSDYCRLRRIISPQGESVIGLYHLKSKKADAALAATDAGTITVYDLTLPPQWSGINVKEIREDCSVVAVWHARTPLLGMQVVEVATPVGSEKSRWKVVVWGRNGFSTVLSLQI